MPGTNPHNNEFGTIHSGNPEGRGGSTNPPKGEVGTRSLGTSSTNPTSKTGAPQSPAKG